MVLDALVVLFVALGVLRGWRRGVIFQIGQVAAAVAGVLAAQALGSLVAPELAVLLELDGQLALTASFVLLFVAVYVVGSVIAQWIIRELHEEHDKIKRTDRLLGAPVGGAKALVLVYVVFVALIMVARVTGKVPIPYGSSTFGRFAMRYNVLDSDEFPRGRALVQLAAVVNKRETLSLVRDPHFLAILQHPKARVLATPEVTRALLERDWVALMGEPGLWDLLDEPEIQAHLNALEKPGATPAGPKAKTQAS